MILLRMSALYFLPSTNLSVVFWTFAVAMGVFHVLLIFVFKLGKTGWKVVDYFWLAAAGMSLVGASSDARRNMANGYMELTNSEVRLAWQLLKLSPGMATWEGGPCDSSRRTADTAVNKSTIDREYSLSCAWIKNILTEIGEPARFIEKDKLSRPPDVTVAELRDAQAEIVRGIDGYNAALSVLADLQGRAQRYQGETALLLLSPLLLAIALALRFTKVTGELLLDRAKPSNPPESPPNPVQVNSKTPPSRAEYPPVKPKRRRRRQRHQGPSRGASR